MEWPDLGSGRFLGFLVKGPLLAGLICLEMLVPNGFEQKGWFLTVFGVVWSISRTAYLGPVNAG